MTSVASHTSTRSKKSSRHGKHRHSKSPDPVEKLVVKTAGLQLEQSMKTASPRPEIPGETLPVLLGHRTRRSRCTPEFLQELASRDPLEIYEEYGKKVKIVTGPEAVSFYKQFQGGSSTAEILGLKEGPAPHVVFAVASEDERGRKRADYYTTWAVVESARDPIEAKRLKHLHSQFRKTARVLDTEFRRASIYGIAVHVLPEKNIENEPMEPPTTSKARPPSILAPPPELQVEGKITSPPSATDSVMSLPYLDFIRNVPKTHRIPLRVTNPDARISIISSLPPASPTTPKPLDQTKQEPLASIAEVEPIYFPPPTPFFTPVAPAEGLLSPETVKKSNSSIRSSRSESNQSSAASTVSVETQSHQSKHRVKEIPEYLIVLLDEVIEKENHTRTWHGLERQVSRSTTKSSSRISGWDGPLARETGRSFSHPAHAGGDESSEEEDEWDNGPVIPVLPQFGITRSFSEPQHLDPLLMLPPHFQRHRLPISLGGSPIGSFANLGYGPSPIPPPAPMLYPHSPYAPVSYISPYHSPAAPPMRTMSRSSQQPPFRSS